jgi:tetratricopeptide (TPR) repeat protein
MTDNPRIEDLRRRIQKDPASIAFAQLAEEYRRAGQHAEAIDVCRTGLALHPGYLSARVTKGRALIELGQDADAQAELELVVKGAPENLAAIRGLAGIHHRRGALVEALAQYRTALSLARNDPDLEDTVNDLTRQLTPQNEPEPSEGLSLAQMQEELAVPYAPPPPDVSPLPDPEGMPEAPPASPPVAAPAPRLVPWPSVAPTPVHTPPAAPLAAQHPRAADADPDQARAIRTLVVLEQWLAAIHVPRADRHP